VWLVDRPELITHEQQLGDHLSGVGRGATGATATCLGIVQLTARIRPPSGRRSAIAYAEPRTGAHSHGFGAREENDTG